MNLHVLVHLHSMRMYSVLVALVSDTWPRLWEAVACAHEAL